MYFPGDPLFALDPIYQAIVDPARPRAAGRDVRPRRDAARVGHRLPLGHRADRHAPHPDGGRAGAASTPTWPRRRGRPSVRSSATRCPYAGDERAGPGRPPGRGPPARHRVRRRRATRSPTPCSRSGRPTPTGARRRRRRARCTATAGPSPASGARRSTRAAATPSPPCVPGPARPGARAVLRDDRLRPRAAQPAVHPRLPPRRRGGARPPTRCWPACPRTGAHTLVATRDAHGFVFDVRLQGDDETVFLHHGSPGA